MTPKPVAEMSFEDAMRELEDLVKRLERGEVALEESIQLYKRGAELRAHCDLKLRSAAEEVEKITLGEGGRPAGSEPFSAG